MKTIALFLISTVFLLGCDQRPKGCEGLTAYESEPPYGPSPEVVDTVYYKAKVVVKMESGDPCKNAIIHLEEGWENNQYHNAMQFYPDSTDTIHVILPKKRFSGYQYSLYPDHLYMITKVYMDQENVYIVQEVSIRMNRSDIMDLDTLIYNVIFPDSL